MDLEIADKHEELLQLKEAHEHFIIGDVLFGVNIAGICVERVTIVELCKGWFREWTDLSESEMILKKRRGGYPYLGDSPGNKVEKDGLYTACRFMKKRKETKLWPRHVLCSKQASKIRTGVWR